MWLGSSLKLFPTYGAYDLRTVGTFFPYILSILHHAFYQFDVYHLTSWLRASYLERKAVSVLGDDYVNAAIVRGLLKSN